jgi:imidazolonepropionase-like amidohydrolase
MLIASGVAVALATDANPGGGLSPVDALRDDAGMLRDGLTFEESLLACTLNAALFAESSRAHRQSRSRQAV